MRLTDERPAVGANVTARLAHHQRKDWLLSGGRFSPPLIRGTTPTSEVARWVGHGYAEIQVVTLNCSAVKSQIEAYCSVGCRRPQRLQVVCRSSTSGDGSRDSVTVGGKRWLRLGGLFHILVYIIGAGPPGRVGAARVLFHRRRVCWIAGVDTRQSG